MTLPPSPASAGSSASRSRSRSPSASSPSAPTSSATSSIAGAPGDETALVARLLLRLEDQIDDAFATCGLLGAALVDARRQHRLSAVAGQQAFARVAAVAGMLGDARGGAVEAHRLLEALGKRIGLPVVDYGDGTQKPNG